MGKEHDHDHDMARPSEVFPPDIHTSRMVHIAISAGASLLHQSPAAAYELQGCKVKRREDGRGRVPPRVGGRSSLAGLV